MPRTLSSAQTLFMKVFFPAIWIGGFTSITIAMFLNGLHDRFGRPTPEPIKWVFLVTTLVGTALIYWSCIRLKRVSLDGSSLIISNFVTEVAVPLSDLEKVSENRWVSSHPVTLVFRQETAFGRSIVFIPKVRWFGFLSSHPVVQELRDAAGAQERDVT